MDRVLESLGWMGRYQKIQFLLLMVPVIDVGLHVMSFIFLGKQVDYKCAEIDASSFPTSLREGISRKSSDGVNSTLTVTYKQCSVSVTNQSEEVFSSTCINGYQYSEPPDRSFVSEWDLVCDRGALPEVSQTVMAVGKMIGASFMVTLADKYGRRPVYVVSHVLYFCTAVATAFVPTFTGLLGVKFAQGAFHQGTGLVSAIMLMELLPTEKRAFPSQVGSFVWPSGLLFLGLICYLCQEMSWRHTELVLAAFSTYSLFQWWLVKESLRWLDAHGKTKEAESIIKKAAKKNGVNPSTVLTVYKEDTQKLLEPFPVNGNGHDGIEQTVSGRDTHEHGTREGTTVKNTSVQSQVGSRNEELAFSTFLKNRTILIRTAICSYMWFTDSVAYYGLIMTSTSLTDDFYLGYALNILVELPAAAALASLINRIGRRQCMILSHLIGGVSLATTVLLSNVPQAAEIPGINSIILTVSLLGKFGISLGFGVLFVFTPELFPTTIRSTGLGISAMFARVGGMLAPHSRTLIRHLPWLPGTIFATLALMVPVLVRMLPETHGHELPQTVADLAEKARPVPPQRTPIVIGLSIKKREDTDSEMPQT